MARFGDFDQYLDNAGDPLAEGKLYFYESGTTTPKTTYADINNSIPNTNPVLLSAAGRQPNIFFDGVAKVILTDNDNVQLIVRDPVGETATDFGDQWVSTKIYNATDVVLGSDGTYYRSLINGNQNNNPVTTTGNWTLLYSVEWNAGITYQVGAVVTYDGEQYQSLQGSNLNQNPSSASSYWVLLSFAWLATATYSEDQNAVGTDGILYTSLQNSNTGNDPASSPAYWVGTSAAAAASAVAAAASAAAALVSENAAAADAIATAADVVQTGLDAAATAADAIATAADRVQTGLDAAATAADVILTNADAVATAADRVQTGLDAAATSADAIATAADRVQTGLDVIATNADAIATAADAIATAADVVQTGLDVVATSADVVQTGLDVTAAAGSASAASGSASAAAGSAAAAAASYDAFDDRYLGDKASDPTLDNDGNALLTGALYFNTTSDVMKVYDGSAWNIAAISSASPTFTGTVTADGLSLGDNDKATFGAGNDLEIYSDGANAIIDHTNTGAGALFIKGDNNVIITNQAGTENKAVFASNGAVSLYYDNAIKLATTATGIDVTGTATMDGLTVSGASALNGNATISGALAHSSSGGLSVKIGLNNASISNSTDCYIGTHTSGGMGSTSGDMVLIPRSNANSAVQIITGNGTPTKTATFSHTGDISFYEDTGTTPKFFWDASAESLGIGTSSPSYTIESVSATSNNLLRLRSEATAPAGAVSEMRIVTEANGVDIQTGSGDYLAFSPNFTEAMRIDASGNVGIGTSSPSSKLHVLAGNGDVAKISGATRSLYFGADSLGMMLGTGAAQTGSGFYFGEASNFIYAQTNSTERLRIDSTGNVGIGTSSPFPFSSAQAGLTLSGTSGSFPTRAGALSFISQDTTSTECHIHARDAYMAFETGTSATSTERMRIASNGNVGIGELNPFGLLHLKGDTNANGAELYLQVNNNNTTDNLGAINFGNNVDLTLSKILSGTSGASNSSYLTFSTSSSGSESERMRIDSSGKVGIGTSSPTSELTINGGATSTDVRLQNTNSGSGAGNGLDIGLGSVGDNGYIYLYENGYFYFATNATERMRIDASGNLLVGKTAVNSNVVGFEAESDGKIAATRSAAQVAIFNRTTSDGDIVTLRKDGTTVGSIGSASGLYPYIGGNAGGSGDVFLVFISNTSQSIRPATAAGVGRDNAIDLGASDARFDDIYATNGTIQTSDRNEKQDIESLSEAEQRVAVAAKGLLRKFRWKSSVEENGDDARIHFGIIAQDLQAAFEAEGLDAGRYAMFIHSTWTDEETGEERSRMGVRYSELLAFIIAAL
jgi:hypothetical protein